MMVFPPVSSIGAIQASSEFTSNTRFDPNGGAYAPGRRSRILGSLACKTWSTLLLGLLCFCVPSHAANFYVSNSGSPSCSNSTSGGSEANPWCTINYGLDRINSGDTLFVKAGTYTEIVTIEGPAGTANSRTTLRAFPGHIVTIRGTGFSGSGRFKVLDTSYITVDGFIVTNFNQGVFVENSINVIVQNMTVHTVGQEAIHVLKNSSLVTIQNNTVYNTRNFDFNGEGIYIGTGSGGPLDNTNNVTVRGNTIHDTTDEGIELKAGTHDCIVEGNTIYNVLTDSNFDNSVGSIEVNQASSGEQAWGSNPNHIIRNNVIHNTKTGIHAETGTTIYNNMIYNIASPFRGIYVDNITNDNYTRRIYHNTVDLPSSRAIVQASGTTTDIRNNIGPPTANNIATSSAYYVNAASGNYHLASGSAPINAGVNLTGTVATDIENISRSVNSPPDFGAYEFAQSGGGGGGGGEACDLNVDGNVNVSDVQLSVNMVLGLMPCTAVIVEPGVCDVVVVQRVVNATLGGPCVTDSGPPPPPVTHSVSLTWAASNSPNVVGHNVYRGSAPGGPYAKINSSMVGPAAYTDGTVQNGQTYHYVVTAVNQSNLESAFSNVATAAVPSQ